MVVTCDVSDYAAMTDVRDQVLARFGRVDCLMNNAGAMVTRGLPWEDLEGWKAQVDINLWGIIHGCHAFCLAWSSKTRQAPSLIQGQARNHQPSWRLRLQPVQGGRLGLHPKPCSRATANRGVPGQCTPTGARPYVFQHDSALCSGEAARCVDHATSHRIYAGRNSIGCIPYLVP